MLFIHVIRYTINFHRIHLSNQQALHHKIFHVFDFVKTIFETRMVNIWLWKIRERDRKNPEYLSNYSNEHEYCLRSTSRKTLLAWNWVKYMSLVRCQPENVQDKINRIDLNLADFTYIYLVFLGTKIYGCMDFLINQNQRPLLKRNEDDPVFIYLMVDMKEEKKNIICQKKYYRWLRCVALRQFLSCFVHKSTTLTR